MKNDFENELFSRINELHEDHDESAPEKNIRSKRRSSGKVRSPSKRVLFSRILKEMIVCLNRKNYRRAEALRKELFKISPNATRALFKTNRLSDLVKNGYSLDTNKTPAAADVCHQGKTSKESEADIRIEFKGFWFDLFLKMTSKEMLGFSKILKTIDYTTPEELIKQDRNPSALYFMVHGNATITRYKNGMRLFKKTLNWGNVAGTEAFFGNGASIFALNAGPETQLEYIEKKAFEDLVKECPEFYQKFFAFCKANEIS